MTAIVLRTFAILLLAGSLFWAGLQYNSSSWPTTSGIIGRSGWAREHGLSTEKGVFQAQYEYQVDGKSYSNDWVSFNSNISIVHILKTAEGDLQNVERSPHPGDIVRIHYAPWWPAVSVLMPGPSPTAWIYVLVCLLIGVGCFAFAHMSSHPIY